MGLEQLGSLMFSGGGRGGGGGDAYARYYYDTLKEQDKRAYEKQQAQGIAGLVDQLYGRAAQPEVLEDMGQFAGPPAVMQEAQQGTGLLGSGHLNPIQQLMMEREKAMVGSAMTPLQEAALGDQDILMNSVLPEQQKLSNAARMGIEAGHQLGSKGLQDFVNRYAHKPTGTTVKLAGNDRINVTEAQKMQYPDGSQVQPGTTWDQISQRGGHLKNNIPAGDAGKLVMIESARAASPQINNLMFKPDGALNNDVINAMSVMKSMPGGQAGHAFAKQGIEKLYGKEVADKANLLSNRFELGMQAITRTETGAAMPPSEVQNTYSRFLPFYGDDADMARDKLNSYNHFLELLASKMDSNITDPAKATAHLNALADEAEQRARENMSAQTPDAPVPQSMGKVIME